MRLTLRTLLAYMDDILEPEDAQTIGKKIKESEFATGLLHRARDVMQRLRLAAPEVADRGAGLDPNTVAEYLDNTLGDDRVPDFEKVCLESDAHLAEVASCHQILTLVLGEPAEVDAPGRRRMYQLPDQLAREVETDAASPGAPTGADAEEEPYARRHRPTVPAYLREPALRRPRRRLPAVAALLVTAIAVVGLLTALGQFEPGTPLAKFLGIGADSSAPDSSAPDSGTPDSGGPVAQVPAETPESPAEIPAPDESMPDQPEAESTPAEAKPPSDAAEPVREPTETPSREPAPENQTVASAPAEPAGTQASPAKEPAAAEPGTIPKADAPKPQPDAKPTTAPVAKPGAAPTELAMRPDIEKPAVEGPKPETKPDEPAPAPPDPIGKLVSDGQVLLEFDPGSVAWRRVPTEAGVPPRYELLALPTYRPIVALNAEIELQLIGGTQVTLQGADQEGVAGLTVRYGRCVLRANGKADSQLRLRVGDRAGVLTFRDTKSTVAIEVTRPLVPGKNPETEPADETVDLYAISGRLLWTAEEGGQPMEFDALARLRLDGQSPEPAAALREFPKWTVSDEVSPLDKRASNTLEQALQVDRPVSLTLRELTDHRQREVRWLAIRCLGYIGEFDPMVAVLNDPNQKLLWPDYIEHLQGALSRGPEAAVQIRRAFQKEYRAEEAELLRLLCGFTKEGLQDGQAELLVKYLDHEILAVRALSFWNLKKITGLGLYYQPEATAAKRRQSVQKWRQRLESGQIWAKPTEKKPARTGTDAPDAPLPEGL